MCTVFIDGKPLEMEIDSGSGQSLIDETTFRQLWSSKIKLDTENLVLKTYTDEKVKI